MPDKPSQTDLFEGTGRADFCPAVLQNSVRRRCGNLTKADCCRLSEGPGRDRRFKVRKGGSGEVIQQSRTPENTQGAIITCRFFLIFSTIPSDVSIGSTC